jgi:RNA polymerase primary sigma factor
MDSTKSTHAERTVPSPLELLLREAAATPLLTADEERELGRQVRAGRRAAAELRRSDLPPEERAHLEAIVAAGEAARRRFVEANQRLVVSVARRHPGRGLELEDLVQEGNLGLLRAIERFDPERGLRFSTYAIWWIKQAIQRALDERGRPVRLPGHVACDVARLWRMADRLAAETGGDPDVLDVADAVGIEPYRALELARATLRPVSLDAVVDEEGAVTLGDLLAGNLEDPDDALERAAVADVVGHGLAELPPPTRRVLELRFGLADGQPRTLAQVGQELRISTERVRRLEADGLRRLRRALRPLRPLLMGD